MFLILLFQFAFSSHSFSFLLKEALSTPAKNQIVAKKQYYTTSNGDYIYSDIHIQKPGAETKVILHGLLDSSFKYYEMKEKILKRGQNVILVDLLQHGKSKTKEKDPYAIDYSRNAEAVTELLLALKVKNLHIIGHSYGGAIAFMVAKNLKPKRLSLLSPYVKRLDSYWGSNPFSDAILDWHYSYILRPIFKDYILTDPPLEDLTKNQLDRRIDAGIASARGIRPLNLLDPNTSLFISNKTKIDLVAAKNDEVVSLLSLEKLLENFLSQGQKVHWKVLEESSHNFPKKIQDLDKILN